MVLHIRVLAAASGAFRGFLRPDPVPDSAPTVHEEGGKEELHLLVKNALITPEEPRPDVSRIWSELSSRVKGPFGRLAIEGPAFTYREGAAAAPQLSRDGLAPSPDFSAPLSAAEEVQSTAVYRGADCHQMNLR